MKKERFLLWIVRRIPKTIRYWTVIDAFAKASTTEENANTILDDLGFSKVIAHLS